MLILEHQNCRLLNGNDQNIQQDLVFEYSSEADGSGTVGKKGWEGFSHFDAEV